jgi:hypothetical protein
VGERTIIHVTPKSIDARRRTKRIFESKIPSDLRKKGLVALHLAHVSAESHELADEDSSIFRVRRRRSAIPAFLVSGPDGKPGSVAD